MFDDCTHNFALNKQSGLRIRPFSDCRLNRDADMELLRLAGYLRAIATKEADFRALDHSEWEKYMGFSRWFQPIQCSTFLQS